MQGVFLVKKAQQAFITEYPKEGHPSYSVIKDILFNFEILCLVKHVSPKHKN